MAAALSGLFGIPLQIGAAFLVLLHNHPDMGSLQPRRSDIDIGSPYRLEDRKECILTHQQIGQLSSIKDANQRALRLPKTML